MRLTVVKTDLLEASKGQNHQHKLEFDEQMNQGERGEGCSRYWQINKNDILVMASINGQIT